jgi:ubiquinone/menaquinone biosynthesis C-methylase UbiE
MAEQVWDSFARLNAGERFKAQSAEMGAAVTEAIVAAARVDLPSAGGPLRVLDVACGSGEPSISIASHVRGRGSVVGIDLAAAALEVARQRAAAKGLDNAQFVQADVHALPFDDESFDRVTSRMGVMFFADVGAALKEIHRVLRPGGRVALLAWGPMEQPYFDSTIGSLRRRRPELEIPDAARQMFKFGDSGSLSRELRQAGFLSPEQELQRLRWDWHGPPEELWEYFRGVTVPFHPLLAKVEDDAEAQGEVIAALRERYDGEYVRFEAQMVMAVAMR